MAYNIKLANRIREALAYLPDIEEKEMFRGICFMVDGKMCVCVSGNEMMCRIGERQVEKALEKLPQVSGSEGMAGSQKVQEQAGDQSTVE